MADTNIVYGTGNAPGLPPLDLPSLDPTQQQQQPLRIEVTKTAQPQAPQAGPPVRPWTAPEAHASSDEVPPVRPWSPPEAKTPEREVGSGEATFRGLGAGASFEFEPAIVGGYQAAKTALGYGEPGQTAGQAYDTARQSELEENARAAAQHPYLYYGAELGGTALTSLVPGVGLARGATTAGRIAASTLAGTVGGTLTGTGESVSRSEGLADTAINAAKGGAAGAVLGTVGGAGVEGLSAVGRRVTSIVRGRRNPGAEVERIVAEAAQGQQTQRQIGQRTTDTAAIRAGNRAGTDARLVDYLGTPGHARLRSAMNINPEAKELAGEFVQGRYHQQAPRVANYLRSKFGAFDTEADREALTNAARKANAPNYRAAEVAAERGFPGGIWSPKLEQLAGGEAVPAAIQAAAKSARDRGVAEGTGAFHPKVTFENGTMRFHGRRGVNSYPDLRLWDYAQRELRDAIGEAQRAGRNEEASRLISLRTQLVDELDRLVPEFGDARGVSAKFFKVADASEAGERFVTDNSISDVGAARAIAKMSAPERTMFARAFAAKLADMVERSGYSANVLNNMFVNSPRALRRIQIALGPQGAGEVEALLRIEGLIDRTRRAAVGNSTTTEQRHGIGLAAGAGITEAIHAGLNPLYVVAAGIMIGSRQIAREIDQQVALRVAQMLLEPASRQRLRGLQIAARTPWIRDALRHASNASAREIINAMGPSGALAAEAATAKHLNPFGSGASEVPQHQGSYDDQYDYDRAGGSLP